MSFISTVPSNDGSVSFSIWYWLKRARDKLVLLDTIPPTFNGFFGNKSVGIWNPLGATATGEVFGCGGAVTATSSGNAAGTQASTNIFTQQRRLELASAAAIDSPTGIIHTNQYFYRGDASGKGGFLVYGIFGFKAMNSNSRWGFGFHNTSTLPTGNNDPSTYTNSIWIGQDAADTNIQTMCKDGSTANKTDLGTALPRPTVNQDLYLIGLYAPSNGNSVDYYIYNKYNGNSSTGKLTTNLPVNTNTLYFCRFANTGHTIATAVTPVFGSVYTETPY